MLCVFLFIECPYLYLENGKVLASANRVGSLSRFVCNKGRVLKGDSLLTCHISGMWRGDVPTCEGK